MQGVGDQRFEAITIPHVNALFQTALRLTENRACAQEVVREAYECAWKSLCRREEWSDWRVGLFKALMQRIHRRNRGWFSAPWLSEPDQTSLEKHTQDNLARYVEVAHKLGIPARSAYRIGTDVVEQVSELCCELSRQYPRAVFFAGEVVFDEPRWFDRLLHNDTAYAIQRRLRFAGVTVVILPVRLRRKQELPLAA